MRGSNLKKCQTKCKISDLNCLSKCPESREMDFDIFRKNIVRAFCEFWIATCFFSKKWSSYGSSEGVCQVKKGSYIDPLVMRFSPKSEFLIGNFYQNFSFLVKLYFLFFQYRKSVLKKTQIFGSLFEPCSSCVDVDVFLSEKNDFWKKETPQRVILK